MEHNRLSEIRNRVGMTQKQLADKLGVTQQTIWYYENGKREMKSSVLIAMSDALGCSVSELLGIPSGNGVIKAVRTNSHYLPVVGRIPAGEAREAIEQSDRTHPVPDELYEGNEDSVWLEVSGNSMNRILPDGSLALVNRRAEVRNGDVAAVFVNGDDATIKRVFFEHGVIRLHPESYDPEYRDRTIDESDPDAPAVHIIGKVVAYSSPIGWRA